MCKFNMSGYHCCLFFIFDETTMAQEQKYYDTDFVYYMFERKQIPGKKDSVTYTLIIWKSYITRKGEN